jgi:hypothetical protein
MWYWTLHFRQQRTSFEREFLLGLQHRGVRLSSQELSVAGYAYVNCVWHKRYKRYVRAMLQWERG